MKKSVLNYPIKLCDCRTSLAFRLMPQGNAVLDCSPIAAAGHVIPQSYVPISVSQFMDDLSAEEDIMCSQSDNNYVTYTFIYNFIHIHDYMHVLYICNIYLYVCTCAWKCRYRCVGDGKRIFFLFLFLKDLHVWAPHYKTQKLKMLVFFFLNFFLREKFY